MVRKIGLKLLNLTINLTHTTFSFFMILIFSKRTKKIVKQRDKECVILGNGPSLLEDLEKLKNCISDKILVCVNSFALTDEYVKLKPSIYVFMDPGYWESLDVTKTNHLDILQDRDKTFSKILEITDWPMIIYVPFRFKDSSLYKICENKNITFIFFNSFPMQGFKWLINFSLNHRLGLLKAANVVTAALYFAIMSEYKTIYLSGVDHSWINSIVVLEDSKVYMAQSHFYDNDTSFNPIYLNNKDNESPKLYKLLEIYSNVFKNYWILADFAGRMNCRIINLTKKSHIDAFPKYQYNCTSNS